MDAASAFPAGPQLMTTQQEQRETAEGEPRGPQENVEASSMAANQAQEALKTTADG